MAKRVSKKKAIGKNKAVPGIDTKAFLHDRFGMFIHWGIYSLGGKHEWHKKRQSMTDADYQKYVDHFDPDLYDPNVWAQRAREAGMKYFVITTKHHEGFCLWDTKLTEYKATNTPYGKDLLQPFVFESGSPGPRQLRRVHQNSHFRVYVDRTGIEIE